MTLASLRSRNKRIFNKAYLQFEKKLSHWEEAKKYYFSIFTIPFNDVMRLNRRACLEKIQDTLSHKNRLPEVASFIERNLPIDNYGIYDGLMGCLIWLCHYERYSNSNKWRKIIAYIWNKIEMSIMLNKIPLNFKNGLAGIGWGLLYLNENGFIEDDVLPVISEIDRGLKYFNPMNLEDIDFATGCSGLLAYCVARKRFALSRKESFPWPDSYVNRMVDCILNKSVDVSSQMYAFQAILLQKEGLDSRDLKISLQDWMTFKDFIPKNPKNFEINLVGNTLSTSLRIMLIEK